MNHILILLMSYINKIIHEHFLEHPVERQGQPMILSFWRNEVLGT